MIYLLDIYDEIVNNEKIVIKSLRFTEIYSLNRMYSSLSNKSKFFFHPPNLQWTLKPICIITKTLLILSTLPLIEPLRVKIFPVGVMLPIIAVNTNNEAIGFANLVINKRIREGYVAGLSMGVHDRYQGKKIGSYLIERLLRIAHRFKVHKIILTVDCKNKIAISLYKKFGFEIEEKVQNGDFWDGRSITIYKMSKILNNKNENMPDNNAF